MTIPSHLLPDVGDVKKRTDEDLRAANLAYEQALKLAGQPPEVKKQMLQQWADEAKGRAERAHVASVFHDAFSNAFAELADRG